MNLNQVTIPVTDLSRSIHFYSTLGLRLIVESQPRYARFECPDGDSTFSLHKADEAAAGTWIYFEVDDVDASVTRLRNLGLVFEGSAADQPWLWREARLKDPDGHTIIIYHAGDSRKNPPRRIGQEDV